MNLKSFIPYLGALVLCSCASQGPVPEPAEIRSRIDKSGASEGQESEWKWHLKKTVPNVFGDRGRKESLKHGFYEQDGTVLSNASWEAVAHYSFLAYRGSMIGNAGYPYSISPSGRFVVIPVSYSSGEESRKLKVYDKKRGRFLLREVGGQAIEGYDWSPDERSIVVTFENEERKTIRLAKVD